MVSVTIERAIESRPAKMNKTYRVMLINRTNVSVTPHASLQYTWLRTGS